MTRTEAIDLFSTVDTGVAYQAIRNIRREVDEVDDLVWWTAEFVDAETEDEPVLAHVQFHEHWPEVEVTWV